MMSVLQFGHRKRFCNQFSRQSSWNVCPHLGTTFTFSAYSKSQRQIEQLLYLKTSSFLPDDPRRLATELQTSHCSASSSQWVFLALTDFSVLFESSLDVDTNDSFRWMSVSLACISKSSSPLMFGKYVYGEGASSSNDGLVSSSSVSWLGALKTKVLIVLESRSYIICVRSR